MSKFVKVPCYVCSLSDCEDSLEFIVPCSEFVDFCDSNVVEFDVIVTRKVDFLSKV